MAAIELNSTPLISDANLVSYWRFEGNSNDSKGSNNGTDTSVTYGANTGKFGQGATLAAGSGIAIPSNSGTCPTGNFTIGIWFKTTESSNYGMLYGGSRTVGSNYAGISIFKYNINKIGVQVYRTNGSTGSVIVNLLSASTYNDGNWHLMVFTWDGSTYTLYVDDATPVTYSSSTAPNYLSPTYTYIGTNSSDGSTLSDSWVGTLDDGFIFSRALTSTETSNLYTGNWPSSFIPKVIMF